MRKYKNSYAFIDSQNLNLSIHEQGWLLDFKRFRKYLDDKYGVSKAFLFIGYMPTNQNLYISLQSRRRSHLWTDWKRSCDTGRGNKKEALPRDGTLWLTSYRNFYIKYMFIIGKIKGKYRFFIRKFFA